MLRKEDKWGRYNISYCPICCEPLQYDNGYFFCDCEGWYKLKWFDRAKEIERAENYDYRYKRFKGAVNEQA